MRLRSDCLHSIVEDDAGNRRGFTFLWALVAGCYLQDHRKVPVTVEREAYQIEDV